MKPYIAEILEHNGRTCKLPIPSKYRELLSCAAALGLKDAADEDDLNLIGYESLIGITPELSDNYELVEETAEMLSKRTEEQVKAIAALCKAFNITEFNAVHDIIKSLEIRGYCL